MKKSPNHQITESPNTNESGQTLLLAVLAIIILLIAALFLFDLQNIIRVKVKAQTAADAASLAGAKMQMESLNLIGEINLIKACTVLITDYADGSSPDQLMAASDNLTEMQARISFVGPLIGLGAAQQAAKNNGIVDPAEIYSGSDYETFSLAGYIQQVRDDEIYGTEDYEQIIEGYAWRDPDHPYANMLEVINNQGIAAGPNIDMPNINSLFNDVSLYEAIMTEFWCHQTLRWLLKQGDGYYSGQWWQGLVGSVSFVEESELLPLYVEYTGRDETYLSYDSAVEDAHEYLTDLAEERDLELGMITQMPYMKWCIYDGRWDNAPGEGWVDSSNYLYLRRGLRTEYLYGGAVTKMTCLVPGSTDGKFTWLSGSYQIHDIQREEGVISQGEAVESPTVRASAMAKPLGFLEDADGNKLPPNDVSMILPVFTSVRLIPVAMQPATSIYDQSYLLYKFLKWLDDVTDLNNPGSPPAGTEMFLMAMQRLNDMYWRHKGYNPSFAYVPPQEAPIYDPSTDTGAGVLQLPVPDPGPPPEYNSQFDDAKPNDGYEYDDDEVRTGIRYTYEDRCDWDPGGPGGGGGGGGPGQLH